MAASLLPTTVDADVAAGEEAAQREDIDLLLRLLHVSLDFSACTKRHLPRSLRLLQRAAPVLAKGPLSGPQTAAESEETLLIIHKCCALVRSYLQAVDTALAAVPVYLNPCCCCRL